MKRLIVSALFISLFLNLQAQETESANWRFDEELTMNWSFKDLSQIILSEFPEAYPDLMEISFIRSDTEAYPGTASFLIPTAKLKQIEAAQIKQRIKNIILKMGDIGACSEYRIGEPSTYSWTKWPDKNVSKVYIDFNIGC